MEKTYGNRLILASSLPSFMSETAIPRRTARCAVVSFSIKVSGAYDQKDTSNQLSVYHCVLTEPKIIIVTISMDQCLFCTRNYRCHSLWEDECLVLMISYFFAD